MNADDTIQMDIATVLCPICPWSINLHRPTGLGRQAPEFDLYSQRKMDDALVEHLRGQHGLMSVLQHTAEMNAQADRSFADGRRDGLNAQTEAVKKAMREVIRDLMTPVVEEGDD